MPWYWFLQKLFHFIAIMKFRKSVWGNVVINYFATAMLGLQLIKACWQLGFLSLIVNSDFLSFAMRQSNQATGTFKLLLTHKLSKLNKSILYLRIYIRLVKRKIENKRPILTHLYIYIKNFNSAHGNYKLYLIFIEL